jgi:dipeptidyl-peptidase-4
MRTARVLLLLLCGLAAPHSPVLADEKPGRLTLETLFATDSAGSRPSQIAWSPDGRRLSYVWEEALWILDPRADKPGKPEALARTADLAKQAKREDGEFALDEIVWSPRGDSFLLVSDGDLYLYSPAAQRLRQLTETEDDEEAAAFSPDGARLAFVRDFDLHVIDLATGQERALTSDGEENAILNGITDWVYWEELWDRDSTGFWWSPDGSRIAYYRFDEAPVGTYPLIDDSPVYPKVTWQKYPKAGEANPIVRVGVLDLATGVTQWLETGDPEAYLPRVAWAPGGGAVAIQRLNRDQNRLDLLRCGAADGACSTLLTETWPTWINLGHDFHFLPDGRFLWGSDASGWRRLSLHGQDGKSLRPVTPEGWALTSVDSVSTQGDWVVVTGFPTAGLGPIDRQVARARLDGEGWEVLTSGPGTHSALVAPATGSWVHSWHDADLPGRATVRLAGGGTADLPAGPPLFDPAALPKWEFFTIPGPGGSRLPARLLKPEGFDPARRYPVIVYHYGGPGSQMVGNGWSIRNAWHKLMAQRGFAVFTVDNQASLFFGKKGEDLIHRNFGDVNLAAQLAGVDYLKSLPWVDPSRIGLWGWSGGGTNTLDCLLKRPGVWRAGVSGAPVTDWRLYDTIWTERYLDQPEDNPEGYRASSPVTHAANLKDRLLVVHGTGDDNVHPQNTIVLSDAFVQAGVPFEQAIYPGQKHGFRGGSLRHFYERMTEFFERELMAVTVEDVDVMEVRSP